MLARRYAEREQQAVADDAWSGLSSLVVQCLQGVAAEGGSQA